MPLRWYFFSSCDIWKLVCWFLWCLKPLLLNLRFHANCWASPFGHYRRLLLLWLLSHHLSWSIGVLWSGRWSNGTIAPVQESFGIVLALFLSFSLLLEFALVGREYRRFLFVPSGCWRLFRCHLFHCGSSWTSLDLVWYVFLAQLSQATVDKGTVLWERVLSSRLLLMLLTRLWYSTTLIDCKHLVYLFELRFYLVL